jgi:SpoVK/Ycf46/Vps4 family AAA+-type ATPase
MLATEALADIELLIRSRHGIIHIDTIDDERVHVLLRHLSDRMTLPFFTWTRTRGICRDGQANGIYDTQEPAQALSHIVSAQMAALYHMAAFDGLLTNDVLLQRLRDVASELGRRNGALIITGAGITLPPALRPLIASMPLPAPGDDELRALIRHLARDLGRHRQVIVRLDPPDEARLIAALRGLTHLEAEKVLTRAMIEDNILDARDIAHAVAAKKQVIQREGVLEYYPVEESMAEVADMAGLKAWLRTRTSIVRNPTAAAEYGLSFPKGMLLIGVPGCGKSHCARAVAAEWELPLLRMDTGSLYNKFVGETESNFRRAMHAAESVAPCVLFIDELEKAFATGGSEDGGVSQRVLGTFLTWLQERRADVFVVATANDVSKLPPEFLRKGRFDEIFFVDLPDPQSRADIARIHLRKRRQDPDRFDLALLATATRGFSGAEIEQVIVSALYAAFADTTPLTQDHLLREAAATRPLSVMMAERIDSLRTWATERAVPAN